MPFDFEDFPVYKEALQFIKDIDEFLETISPRGNLKIIDQLQRASMSILLNIAEGAGRYHKSDKKISMLWLGDRFTNVQLAFKFYY